MWKIWLRILVAVLKRSERALDRLHERIRDASDRWENIFIQVAAPLKKGTRIRVTGKCCTGGHNRIGQTGTIDHVMRQGLNKDGAEYFEYYVEPDVKRHEYDYMPLCSDGFEVIE